MKKVMIYVATLVTAFGLAVAMNVTNVSAGVGPVKPPVVKPTPKPVPEEPTTEEPTPVEPTTEEPRPEEPTTEEPTTEEPTTEEPITEEPTTEEPTTEEPITEELVKEKAEDPSEGDTAKKTKKSTSVPTGDPVAAMEAGFILLSSASGLVVLRKRR